MSVMLPIPSYFLTYTYFLFLPPYKLGSLETRGKTSEQTKYHYKVHRLCSSS